MKRFLLNFSIGFSVFFFCSCSSQVSSPGIPTPHEPVSITPHVRAEWRLKNGLSVVFFEDKELPLLEGELYIPGGALWEDVEKLGVIGVMGIQMREGGAGSRSPEQLDRELEKLAAGIGSNFGSEWGKVRFSSLVADVNRVFPLFADVALRPRFDDEPLTLWRVQALESIKRRKDDPGTIAFMSLAELLYKGSAYGRTTTSAHVRKISKADLIAAHKKWMRPDNALLVLSGDLDRAEAEALTRRYFSSWKSGGVEELAPPPITSEPEPAIYFIPGPFQQATVAIGELGVPRLTPDYVAIEAFNEILSGSFGSRLFARIRTELGLAYSVNGGISPGTVRGINQVALQTRTEMTGAAVEEVFHVLKALQQDGPTSKELSDSQKAIINSFVFKFSSIQKVAGRTALLRMLKYPPDYDAVHLGKVRGLNSSEVQTVARNRIDLSKFIIVVVGDERAYDTLKKLKESKNSELASLPLFRASFSEKLELK